MEKIYPWYTLPAILFLEDTIIDKDIKVFEYGSGKSSLYYASLVKECYSIEHNPVWYDFFKDKVLPIDKKLTVDLVPQNCLPDEKSFKLLKEFEDLNFNLPLSSFDHPSTNRHHGVHDKDYHIEHGLLNKEFYGYATKIFKKQKGYFDLIVVDGMARVLSMFLASKMIAEDGVIILDNSDRWQYNSGQKYLIENGFGRIDFYGTGVSSNETYWCTSFFSKKYKIKNRNIERSIGAGDLGW